MTAMLEPDVETRPWAEQLGLDDAAYRAQLAYLFERSPFYRQKLDAAAHTSAQASAAWRTSRELPLTDKHELQATCTPENPIGAHLCATPGGDRPHLLDERHDRRAELHPADRRRPRQLDHGLGAQLRRVGRQRRPADRLDLQRRAVRGRRRARVVRAPRAVPHPGRHRQHRAPAAAIERLKPQAAVLTPSYAAYLIEGAAERGIDLRGSSVERVLVAGEPGGGEPAFRAALEQGWGAQVTEAMGIGDIGVSLWGECEQQDGMHLGARGFVHAELIDPETGAADRARGRRHRRARAHPPAPPRRRRCCASAPATTSWSRRARARAGAPARACAASGAPTTC